MSIKKQLSLVALLGFTSCAGSPKSDFSYYPLQLDSPTRDLSSNPPMGNKSLSYISSGSTSLQVNHLGIKYNSQINDSSPSFADQFVNESLGLPKELAREDTSADIGVAQIASQDDSLIVRPIYSPSYKISLDRQLKFTRAGDDSFRDRNRIYFTPDYFTTDNQRRTDDPEIIEHEQGITISILTKWAWSWDLFKPARNVADGVRVKSNEVVKGVFGSHAKMDYNGKRLNVGYEAVEVGSGFLELGAWTDNDFDRQGAYVELVFPIGRR
ncbi:MAG: hypothetical protein AABX23_05085 [Nanoarchaeota archaeon]